MPTPKFEATEEQRKLVEELVGVGLPHTRVLRHIINPNTGKPVSINVFRRAFKQELENGMALTHAKILQTAFAIATNPDHPRCATMNIFMQKAHLGFRETAPSGDEETPTTKIQIVTVDGSKAS